MWFVNAWTYPQQHSLLFLKHCGQFLLPSIWTYFLSYHFVRSLRSKFTLIDWNWSTLLFQLRLLKIVPSHMFCWFFHHYALYGSGHGSYSSNVWLYENRLLRILLNCVREPYKVASHSIPFRETHSLFSLIRLVTLFHRRVSLNEI